MTIDELIDEASEIREYFWFIQTFKVTDRTDATVTLHFAISSDLFVQIFLVCVAGDAVLHWSVTRDGCMDGTEKTVSGIGTPSENLRSMSLLRKECRSPSF
jgi:hypothetical protein